MSSVQGQMVLTFPAEDGAARATLRVASFPSLDRGIHSILPRWKALHPDVSVELGTRRIREHHDALAATLADPAAPAPDVVGLSMDFLGAIREAGLEALDRSPLDASPWLDRVVPYAVQQGRDAAGHLRAVPVDIGPGVVFYRADVLAKAGVTEHELGASWDSFIEAGRRVKAATGASILAHPCYLKDIYLRARQGPGEGLHFSERGEPLTRTPRFADAFRLAVAAREAGIDLGIAPGWTDAWTERVRSGAIAAQLTGAWFLAHLSSWIAPETRGLWRTCAAPDPAVGCWGGAFYGIPRRAARKDLALDFIRLAALDREVQLSCFRQLHAYPALLEAQDDPSFDEPMPFLQGQPARRLWQGMVRRMVAGPLHALDQVAEAAVTEELCRVLDGGKAIAAALSDAERTIRAAMVGAR